MRALVTGATGMVGLNLIEALAKRPDVQVVALVRASSDTRALSALGAEIRSGDMGDTASLVDACEGCDVVFHTAAIVSDWGMREEMIRINVVGLRALLESAVKHQVKRFVLVSSMAVLGNLPQVDVDESAPYVITGDNYNYTKMEAEKLAIETHQRTDLPLILLRPPYLYGPYDRQFLPRLVTAIEREKFMFLGSGKNSISLCYVGNLVEALVKSMDGPRTDARIYHITDGAPVTRVQLVNHISDALGLLRPRKHLPLGVARVLMHVMETKAKLTGATTAPLLNRFRMKFLHTPLSFSIRRAQEELGYGPQFTFEEGMERTLEWFKKNR